MQLALLYSLEPLFNSIEYGPSSSTFICCIGDTAGVGKASSIGANLDKSHPGAADFWCLLSQIDRLNQAYRTTGL